MRKLFLWLLVFVGVFFGLVWWFDVEQTGGNFADFFSDPIGGTQSLANRLGLWVGGILAQLGNKLGVTQPDPKTIAAGLIAGFETFSPTAYPDPPGQTAKYSIGYGHSIVPGDGFTKDSIVSEPDALARLYSDLDTYADCVDNSVTVELGPEQTAALYSFTYNEGCGAFTGSTLLSLLNQGDYEGADAEFARWNIANGNILPALVSRRAKEAEVFAEDISDTEDTTS